MEQLKKRKFIITLKRWNDWVCRHFLDECGYCKGRVYWLPDGTSACQECKRRS